MPQDETPPPVTPANADDRRGSEPQGWSHPLGSDPQDSDPQGSDPLGSDPQGSGPQGSGPQGSDSRGSSHPPGVGAPGRWLGEFTARRRAVGLMAVTAAGAGVASQFLRDESGERAAAPRIDVATLRRFIAERGPIPYEAFSMDNGAVDADEIMSRGWAIDEHPVVRLDLPIDWTTLAMFNRSINYRVHSWGFMTPVIRAYERTADRRYFDWAVDRAVSWARTFTHGGALGTMAWYDMAIGLRAYRLAYLLEMALTGGTEPAAIAVLLAAVQRHQRELLADRTFVAHTNHGFYVAAGQIAFARRLRAMPDMDRQLEQGRQRMSVMARNQFAADGGHLEHSPSYHWMLLWSFQRALAAGLLQTGDVRQTIALADEASGWFIQPDGRLAQVGDSSVKQIQNMASTTESPTTRFLLTRGRRGRPNPERLKVLPRAGYAIVRSPQPTGTDDHDSASYLLLAAAFHSRAHKQADDLSIVWFDRRREILIDAGRYGYVHRVLPQSHPLAKRGYYYSAPERQYVESTMAHNTVAADGMDHIRLGRKPYGSAVTGAEERAGHFRLAGVVDHGAWRHRRDIVFRPGRWLQVTDQVTALDDAPHDFRVWWNFPKELAPRRAGPGRLVIDLPRSRGGGSGGADAGGADAGGADAGGADSNMLWVSELGGSATIAPVSGRRNPLRGWRSMADLEMTPAWSTGFRARNVRRHTFRTLFHFGAEPRSTPMPHPFD